MVAKKIKSKKIKQKVNEINKCKSDLFTKEQKKIKIKDNSLNKDSNRTKAIPKLSVRVKKMKLPDTPGVYLFKTQKLRHRMSQLLKDPHNLKLLL